MKNIEAFIGRITGVISVISYIGFFFIMIFTVLDVLLRYALSSPILGSYEIVERSVFCAVFASFAYAQTQRAHINITMLVDFFPARLKMFSYFVTELMSAVTALLIAYAAMRQANTAFASDYTTAVLYIKLYPFYWIEFLCMLVFAATLLYSSLKSLVAIFNKNIMQEILEG